MRLGRQTLLAIAKHRVTSLLLIGLFFFGLNGVVQAQSVSPNYQVNEYFFGSGGELESCSTTYCSRQSAGETAVGRTSSTAYEAWAGFNTTDTPFLEFSVAGGSIDLGVLSVGATATATTTVSVRTYLSGGYVLTAMGPPPTYQSATIDPLASPTASSAGTEQFGMNLVDNSAPNIGANPSQVPDSSFSFGQVDTDYDNVNQYMYQQGDTIAFSVQSSGETMYTVSYIINVGVLTESGLYETDQVFVATATF